MTIEELDAVYADCRRLILRRSIKSGAKAATIGNEAFDKLIDEISLSYKLSDEEKTRLDPDMEKVAFSFAGKAGSAAKNVEGVTKAAKLAARAAKNGKKLQTVGIWLSKGQAAASRVAGPAAKVARAAGNTGKVASKKAGWIGIAISAGMGVGTGGFFFWRGQKYNQNCYTLIKAKHGLTSNTAQ